MATAAAPPRAYPARLYNAAADLIDRNLEAGRGDKVAFRDDAGSYTYRQLAERVDRFANVLRAKQIAPADLARCTELGAAIAAGLALGVF